MISEDFIKNWLVNTNWQTDNQAEQDLIISRALVCLYNDNDIRNNLVFRGGTALNKLFLKPPARYSEDIDFVQLKPGPIGLIIDKIRALLNPWLSSMKWKITERGAKLIYPYQSVDGSIAKLKIEINTTEHFQVLPLQFEPFSFKSNWFEGACEIITYQLVELMATKLRALYQRRKGRDLFDIWYVFKDNLVDIGQVLDIFQRYCFKDGIIISKELFLKNMELKKLNEDFRVDMKTLLPLNIKWDFEVSFNFVINKIIDNI
ncbi:hypothetical protein phytr_10020 [Candidatus Phycorickettsia trachydisci]|uniref:Nucleotidyl transferase AbiEii/AbiGii toxin family protein n=1 Tax=Candidatus Phycorickettsia trachydisci TaxID=2115978 RepID=A0A2P1P9K6_9RICK|nr:nucleotidyl transferase AbiEii/AbiGii toxin family protein [Candidatus Phycorickettsia trachydisci]AVP87930.1 hypothetical protein phytr_10020 [Candidatus Phycorickettsia trachydisci]